MKKRKVIYIILMICLLAGFAQLRSASAQDEVTFSSSFGLEMRSLSHLDSLVDYADAANSQWIRINGLLWSDVESTKDTYNWEVASVKNLDNRLRYLAANYPDIEVMLIVRSTPLWAQKYTIAGGYDDDYYCGPIKPANYTDFADFMQVVVTRYSDSQYNIKFFEIWNEPDDKWSHWSVDGDAVHGCWGESTDLTYFGGQYFGDMLKEVYPAVKTAVPEAQIVLGGLLMPCDPTKLSSNHCKMSYFLKGILHSGAGNSFDILNIHAYAHYNPTIANPNMINMEKVGINNWIARGGEVVGKLDFLKNVIGFTSKPIMLTETGMIDYLFTHTGDNLDYIDPAYEATKADYVVWLYTRNWHLGQSGYWPSGFIGTNIYNDYYWSRGGLFDKYNNPLPAYTAYQVLTTTLDGAVYQGRLTLNGGEVIVFKFTKGVDPIRKIWVLFSEDGSQETINKSDIGLTVNHVYNRLKNPPVTNTATIITFDRPIYIDDIPNTAPEFISMPVEEVDQNDLYNYQILTASTGEENFDIHFITASTQLPDWLELTDNGDGTATLSGTPDNDDVGIYTINLLVTDSHGETAPEQILTITVHNVNDPPEFTSSPETQANADEVYTYKITATDPDWLHRDDQLTISVETDYTLPLWLTLEDNGDGTAILAGTPALEDLVDPVPIKLQVEDSYGEKDFQSFTIGELNVYLPLIMR